MSESVDFVGAATASVAAIMMEGINFMSMLWLCAFYVRFWRQKIECAFCSIWLTESYIDPMFVARMLRKPVLNDDASKARIE